MKTIDTLVADVYDVLESDNDNSLDQEGITEFASNVAVQFQGALDGHSRARKDKVLYASEIGKKCTRQTAYAMDENVEGAPLKGGTLFKFLYGHTIEEMALGLAKAAGHLVEATQREYEYLSKTPGWRVRGRCDAIIDGHMVDVKSASSFAFKRYSTGNGLVPDNDSFGYLDQLGFYAWQEFGDHNGFVEGSFFWVAKELGNMHISTHTIDADALVARIEMKIAALQAWLDSGDLPDRMSNYDKPDGKSGNRVLCTTCSYCDFKKQCHPEARVFAYKGKAPVWFTQVLREPKVPEITSEVKG